MIVIDTSVIHALLDAGDDHHAQAVAWYEAADEVLATTPLVIAEADFLAQARAGGAAQRAFREDVAGGAYAIEWWRDAAREAVDVADRYRSLGVSLTDASLVALAARLATVRLATFDERHFRAMRPLSGETAFVLLPVDA